MNWKVTAAANLQRWYVGEWDWITVEAGAVAVLDAVAVLVVDGVLRLDGAIRVG